MSREVWLIAALLLGLVVLVFTLGKPPIKPPEQTVASGEEGVLVCNFNSCLNRLKTGCSLIKDLGAFYNQGEVRILEACVKDSIAPTERVRVLRVGYEIDKPGTSGGLYIKPKEFNPWDYSFVSFFIRTDPNAGPEKINVELKVPSGKPNAGWFYHYLSGITDSWKICYLPLANFARREGWNRDLELDFAFEEREVVRPEGVIYLDDIAFVKEAPYEGCQPPPPPPPGEVLLSIEDPRGDDYGPGTYSRPQHNVFDSEPFDIVKFEVREDKENVIFWYQLSDKIKDIWDTRYGLSVQAIDIYLDTKPGGRQDLIFDRTIPENLLNNPDGTFNARLSEKYGWDHALRAQGWEGAVLFTSPDGLNGNKKYEAAEPWGGSLQVDRSQGTITVTVPKVVIGEPKGSWNIATFMFSIDWGNARVVNEGPSNWYFGGGVNGNADPNIIDLVLPTGKKPTQEEVLDFRKGPVVLPVINLGTSEIKN